MEILNEHKIRKFAELYTKAIESETLQMGDEIEFLVDVDEKELMSSIKEHIIGKEDSSIKFIINTTHERQGNYFGFINDKYFRFNPTLEGEEQGNYQLEIFDKVSDTQINDYMINYNKFSDALDIKTYNLEKGKLYYDRALDFMESIEFNNDFIKETDLK